MNNDFLNEDASNGVVTVKNLETKEDKSGFDQYLDDIEQKGYIYLALCLGHKLNLFDSLSSTPRTSECIAKLTGYKERYIREWLAVMFTARIISMENDGNNGMNTFFMSDENRALLTRNDHLSTSTRDQSFLRAFPMIFKIFDKVATCFEADGPMGLAYEEYDGFDDVMACHSDKYIKQLLLDKIIPAVPSMQEKLEKYQVNHLDIGCGRGTPSLILAKTYSNCRTWGVDILKNVVEFAIVEADKIAAKNAQFLAIDAAHLPKEWSSHFDYVTSFTAINDTPYPKAICDEIWRVLKPGSYFSFIAYNVSSQLADNLNVTWAPVYAWSLFTSTPIGCQKDGKSAYGTLFGKEMAQKLLIGAGFINLKFHSLQSTDYFHCVAQKPDQD